MKALLIAAATALALSGGVAFAQGAGNDIGNQTTTSMGAPSGSPNYSAPRSASVPGLPPQARLAQQENSLNTHTDQGVAAPVQGPHNPITGHTQTNP